MHAADAGVAAAELVPGEALALVAAGVLHLLEGERLGGGAFAGDQGEGLLAAGPGAHIPIGGGRNGVGNQFFHKLPPDANTIFELASATKVSWSDPPGFDSNAPTIYSQHDFETAVNGLKPGKKEEPSGAGLPTYYNYSNGSVGFLGQILMYRDGYPAYAEGGGFADWIYVNLTLPLGMYNTTVEPGRPAGLPTAIGGAWATGYDQKFEPQTPFPWEPWGAAGGLARNVSDMLIFLQANICAHHKSDPHCSGFPGDILDALALAHTPNSYTSPGTPIISLIDKGVTQPGEAAWAWDYRPPENSGQTLVIEKNGGHQGCSSFIGFDPDKGYGLVVLMNTHQDTLGDQCRQIIWDTLIP